MRASAHTIRLVLLISFSFQCWSEMYAQESENYLKFKNKRGYYEGYVVKADSSKIYGLINEQIIDNNFYKSVLNFVTKEGKKEVYYPINVIEFSFNHKRYFSDDESFYLLFWPGLKINVYSQSQYKNWGSGIGANATRIEDEKLFVKKMGDSRYKEVRKKHFVSEFSEYFSDCEVLKNRILSKELTHNDIIKIVTAYEKCR